MEARVCIDCPDIEKLDAIVDMERVNYITFFILFYLKFRFFFKKFI
jgi:hypothetical protein